MSGIASDPREDLIFTFMPLARRLASRYHSPHGQEDVEQVAYMALVKAAQRYEPDRGTAFLTYAIPTITGEIKKYFRDTSWSIHVPRGLQNLALKARSTAEEMTRQLGRSPTVPELAERLGVDQEVALEALQAGGVRDIRSLDDPLGSDDDGGTVVLGDTVAVLDETFDRVVDRDALRRALSCLPARERTAIGLRFFDGLTQTEIAARLGVSQMAISRLLRRALESLRAAALEASGGVRG